MILCVCANPAVDRVYFVDNFKMGEVHRPLAVSVTAGGKGLNVAKVSSILGADATVTGFIGGFAGEFISGELKKTKIKDKFIRTDKETRTCVNVSDKSGFSGEILESGAELDFKDENMFLADFKELLKSADIVVISGSKPKGLSPDFYINLLNLARQEGKRCIIDVSGDIFNDVIEAQPFMVKPNRFELGQYVGKEIITLEDCKSALLELYRKGVEIPLCTLGADGALLYYEGKFIRYITPSVTAVNAVGSGDSVVAGIAVGLTKKMTLPDCVKYGMAAGISNTQYKQTGLVDKESVEIYFKMIKCEYI